MATMDDTTPLAALLAKMPLPDADRRKGRLHGSTTAKLRTLIVTGVLAPALGSTSANSASRWPSRARPFARRSRRIQDGLLRALPNQSPVVSELDLDEIIDLIDVVTAIDMLERCVAEKQLRHGGNPVLNMCAANAAVTRDPAGGRKLDKSKAAGRIDGLVALAMALSVSKRHEPEALPACLAELLA